jgi:hypothetical protein
MEQTEGYDRNILIDEILLSYKNKLKDLSMSELEEELEAEKSTTKFGEIPYSKSTQDDRELRPWGENHKRTLNDQRMMAKWEKHHEYSKQTSREDLRQEPRRQSEK